MNEADTVLSVHDAITAGRYENKVPSVWEKIPVHDDMTIKQAREHKEEQERLRREQRVKHYEEQGRLTALLRSDLEREYSVIGHPKAGRVWELAWEAGHSCGYAEVANNYAELVELIKP